MEFYHKLFNFKPILIRSYIRGKNQFKILINKVLKFGVSDPIKHLIFFYVFCILKFTRFLNLFSNCTKIIIYNLNDSGDVILNNICSAAP